MSSQRRSPHRSAGAGLPWLGIVLIVGSVVSLLVALFALRAFFETRSVVSHTASTTPLSTAATDAPSAGAGITLHVSPIPRADVPMLQRFMLTLINEERRANGLPELEWDSTAAAAGLRHAQEMARTGYMSHWNLKGHGPDYRYSLAGGLDAIRENVYRYQHSPGIAPTTADDWQNIIWQAHRELMESPGHRDNVLAPEHTHAGIGIAYRVEGGRLMIAQEFVNHYLTLQPLPRRASVGDTITVIGQLRVNVASPMLNLAYEPLPRRMSVAELNATGAYRPLAEIYDAVALVVDKKGWFEQSVQLDYEGQPGLYHIRIWCDITSGKVLAADVVLEVQ